MNRNLLVRLLILKCLALLISAQAATSMDLSAMLKDNPSNSSIKRCPGRIGSAYDFYRSPKPGMLKKAIKLPTGNWTLETWFRLSDLEGNSSLYSTSRWKAFWVNINDGKEYQVDYRQKNGKWIKIRSYYKFTPGLWYHSALVVDGSTMKVFINGELQGIKKEKEKIIPSNNTFIISIGGYIPNSKGAINHVFKGSINNVILHHKALNEDEINDLYGKGTQRLGVIPEVQQVNYINGKFLVKGTISINLNTDIINKKDAGIGLLANAIRNAAATPKLSESTNGVVVSSIDSKSLPEYIKKLVTKSMPPESYILTVRENRIDIVGKDSNGVYYGLQTLSRLVGRKTLNAMNVYDYPEFPYRGGLFVNDTQPPIKLSKKLKEVIRRFSSARINYLQLRTHDWIALDDPKVVKAVQAVKDYAEKYHIKMIPYLQCYGHAKAFAWKDPRAGHTKMVKDEEVVLADKPVALKQNNVVITSHTPVIVRNSKGKVFQENVDFKVIPGELKTSWKHPKGTRWGWARPYILKSNAPFKIKRVKNGGIKENEEVLVTYDVASCGEGYCPASEYLTDMFKDSFERVERHFHPEYINLGIDEIWEIKGQGRCNGPLRDLSNAEVLAYEMNRAYKVLSKISPKAKIQIFSDMLDERQTPSWKCFDGEGIIKFRKINRNIIMMPWYYALRSDANIQQSCEFFLKHGYKIIGTSGNLPENQLQWGNTLLRLKDKYDVEGFTYTLWASTKDNPYYAGFCAYSQMSWSPSRFYMLSTVKIGVIMATLGLNFKSSLNTAEKDSTKNHNSSTVESVIKDFKGQNPYWLKELRLLVPQSKREITKYMNKVKPDKYRLKSLVDIVNQAETIIKATK